MKKNKITEIDGWGTLTGPTGIDVKDEGRQHDRLHLRQPDHRHRRHRPAASRASSSATNVVTYEEQILDDQLPESIIIGGSGAIGVEFAYVMKNFGVDVTIVEFLDRMVPTEDADVSKELAQALQEARRERADLDRGQERRGHRLRRQGDRGPGRRGRGAGARGRQDPGRVRLRAAGRGLRPRDHRRRRLRPGRDRGRRLRPHQRRERLRHR